MTSIMRWASAIATPSRLEDAVDEAAEAVAADLGAAPDLVLAFPSAHYSDHFSTLAPALRDRFGSARILGCSGGGVIGGGREIEHDAALSITAAVLPEVNVQPFHLEPDVSSWADSIPIPAADEPDLIVLPEPFSCDSAQLIRWLDEHYPDSTKVGGVASGGNTPGSNVLFVDDEMHHTGAAGLAVSGNIELDTIVAQGCRPIGNPMFVTQAAANMLLELDGSPALDVLRTLQAQVSDHDRTLFDDSLFLGVVMQSDQESYEQGEFLIRNLLGAAPEAGALAVATNLHQNQVVQFHLRDADTSAEDLDYVLTRHAQSSPQGALLFSCLGRGSGLYGEPDHDSRAFHKAIGPVPLGGFFCNGEIGPVHGRTFLHGYTSAFGLFRPRHP